MELIKTHANGTLKDPSGLKKTEIKRLEKERKRMEKQLKKLNPATDQQNLTIWVDCEPSEMKEVDENS